MGFGLFDFAKKHGLTKIPKEANNKLALTYCGQYKNMNISVSQFVDSGKAHILIKVFGNFKNSESAVNIKSGLSELSALKYVINLSVKTALSVTLSKKIGIIKTEEIEKVLDIISNTYTEEKYLKECCEHCGSSSDIRKSVASDRIDPLCLCPECTDKTGKTYEAANAEAASQKGNYLKGLLMGFIFSLGGVALWVVITLVGFIAGIAGYVIAYLMYLGYKKAGGKPDKVAVGLIVVLSIVMIALADYISIALIVKSVLDGEGYVLGITDILAAIPQLIEENQEIMLACVRDFAVGVLLTFIASFPLFKAIIEEGKRKTLYILR